MAIFRKKMFEKNQKKSGVGQNRKTIFGKS